MGASSLLMGATSLMGASSVEATSLIGASSVEATSLMRASSVEATSLCSSCVCQGLGADQESA